jgi:hypothetical protein
MKKKNQKNSSKETKLPSIQSNLQKGSVKQNADSQEKLTQKTKNSNVPKIPNIPLTNKNIPNNISSSNKIKSEKNRKKITNNYKEEENTEQEKTKEEGPRITEEKLTQLKIQRKKRIEKEKKEEEKEMKLYTELVEEFKNNNKRSKKNYNSQILENSNKITNVSGAKAQKILEEGGMLDAYKYVLSQLCKQGLPNGNIFEYASIIVKNYEKKWKEKKSKMIKEKIDKYYEEKQKELENENKDEVKIINKSLEHREELKFIQSLDKSRSKRNIIRRNGSFNNLAENENNTINTNVGRSYDNKFNKKINKENNFNELDKNKNKSPKGGNNKNIKENNNIDTSSTNRNKNETKRRKK